MGEWFNDLSAETVSNQAGSQDYFTQLVELVRSKAPQRTVASVLTSAIRAQILSGEIAPGARIVELELAKTYGTSRTTVREALRELIAEDLVEVAKHKSPTVKFLDPQKIYDILSVRAVLEGYAAGLAAVNAQRNTSDREWLEAQLDLWSNPSQLHDHDAFVEANRRLHSGIRRIAKNPTLDKQIATLALPGYQKTVMPLPGAADLEKSAKQHCALLETLLSGNQKRSESLMRKHVEASRSRLTPKMSETANRAKVLSSISLDPD